MKPYFSFFLVFAFLVMSSFLFAQKRLYSNFKLSDYEKLRTEYMKEIEKNKDKIINADHFFQIKKKRDSVLLIKDKIIKEELIKEGVKSSEITQNYLNFVDSSVFLKYAYFKIKKKDFYYYYSRDYDKLYIFKNNGLKIYYWFQGNTNSEFIYNKNNSLKTWNIYFANAQLKETRTFLLPSNEAIGIYAEYDITGKLLNFINLDKDFIHNKNQVFQKAKIYLKNYVLSENFYDNINDAHLNSLIENRDKKIFKDKNSKNKLYWVILINNFMGREITILIGDKKLNLIEIKSIPIIE